MVELLQIKFEFNTTEDRLLLCIFEKASSKTCAEYRFWFTRRFVAIFIKAIDRLIDQELAGDMQISPDAIGAMKKFQHEAAISKADFSSPFEADNKNCAVFGEKPLLAVTLKINKKSKGKYILSFLDNENKGVHLTAGMDLIYTLHKMIVDSVKSTAWNDPLFRAKTQEIKTTKPPLFIS